MGIGEVGLKVLLFAVLDALQLSLLRKIGVWGLVSTAILVAVFVSLVALLVAGGRGVGGATRLQGVRGMGGSASAWRIWGVKS